MKKKERESLQRILNYMRDEEEDYQNMDNIKGHIWEDCVVMNKLLITDKGNPMRKKNCIKRGSALSPKEERCLKPY